MLDKIRTLIKYCSTCGKFVNARKEKQGKGQPPIWYCPHCGTEF